MFNQIFHIGFSSISIHAPREGCDLWNTVRITSISISIHAPREGCDRLSRPSRCDTFAFQSTHPVRGATHPVIILFGQRRNFNPRTP